MFHVASGHQSLGTSFETHSLLPQVSALESESDGLRIARQEASRDLLLARNQGWVSNLVHSLRRSYDKSE